MTGCSRVAGFLSVALLAACATNPTPPGATLYTFVVLGVDGAPVARAITSAAECPAIELDGVARAMSVRARPGVMPQRPTISPPEASKPSAFPVLVCEAAIPSGVVRATIAGRTLPLPKAEPKLIVVIGDSGCRIKVSDRVFQDCNNAATWPFATVAATAAATAPDLVIHVGDYHYRENACPPGNVGCAGSPWGYGWDTWEADFFAPAATLMAAAPWIVVRGNHESCARAGQGWWRFLDPRSLAARQDCNDPGDDTIGDYSEPYAVPFGAGGDAQFIVFDSSLVGVAPLAPTSAMYMNYRAQFERAFALARARAQTFFMNHHPILAFAPSPSKPSMPYPGNGALQSVLQSIVPSELFPPNVQALLSGHVHLFEAVSFTTGQPPQLVSGNAGDWVDTPLPLPLPAGTTPLPGAVVSSVTATNRFGFMTMERAGSRWIAVAHDAAGTPMTICVLVDRHAECTPTGWLGVTRGAGY
jgi:hypothetical protein